MEAVGVRRYEPKVCNQSKRKIDNDLSIISFAFKLIIFRVGVLYTDCRWSCASNGIHFNRRWHTQLTTAIELLMTAAFACMFLFTSCATAIRKWKITEKG